MKLLLLVALLLYGFPGLAQAPAPAPLHSTFSVGKQDTMRALGNMFERRRRAGKIWLGVAAAGGLAAGRVAAGNRADPNPGTPHDRAVMAVVVGGIFGGIPLAMGIAKLAGASQDVQDKVVHDYALGGKVPWAVAHRLRNRDFD